MYIDLNWEVRTNAEFQHKLRTLGKELQIIESKTGSDPAASDKAGSIILDIYRLCKYNAGLLVPYFFPKYPYDKPLSCSNRPYSFAMFHMQIGGSITFRAGRQIGKELSIKELCLTPMGYVPMGTIKLGDTVYDRHGLPTLVTGVFPQGKKDIYRMTFTDKSYVDCGEEHLWMCKTNGARNFGVKTLKEIRALKGGDNPTSDQGIRIPLCSPIQLPAVPHYIQPYILGMLLGDGALTHGQIVFTTADTELSDAFAGQEGIQFVHATTKYHHRINKGVNGEATFRQEVDRLNIRHRAEDKCIPNEYLYDSVENRLELLRGLMDTDGTIYGKCQVEFYSVSKVLAEQVQFLVQSLGGTARIKEKQGWYAKDGVRVDCQICYRVKIKIQDINPFKLKRKADKFYNIRYERTRILESIKYMGLEEAVCISVSSEDKTYITRDCIVTHNSTSLAARQLIYSHIIPKHRSMYVVPHQSYLDSYANRMREMERAFRFYQSHKDFRQNLKYKEYPNGAVTMLVKCLTDTQEARSRTSDYNYYDECVHMNTIVHSIVGETIVGKNISELLANDTVLAYDAAGIVTPARIKYVKNKGVKDVWKLKLSNGSELICTGNTRFWTTNGWMFLCEFLSWEEAERRPTVAEAKAMLSICETVNTGESAWRREHAVGKEICRAFFGESLRSSGGLLQTQGGNTNRLREYPASICTESRVGRNAVQICNPDYTSVQLYVSAGVHYEYKQSGETCKDSNQGVVGRTNVGRDCMVVPGRRHFNTRQWSRHKYTRIPSGPSTTTSRYAYNEGSSSQATAHQKGRQDILHSSNRGERNQNICRESAGIYTSQYALQDSYKTTGNDTVCILSGRNAEKSRRYENRMLPSKGVSKENEGREANSLHRETGGYECVLSYTGEGACGEGPKLCSETESADRKAATRPGVRGEAESAGEGMETNTQIRNYRETQTTAAKRTRLCREGQPIQETTYEGPCAESKKTRVTTATPEPGTTLIPVSIVSIEYVGQEEVWDIETEEHHTFLANGIAVHNSQFLDPDFLPDIEQCQKSSKMPGAVFAGTSTTMESLLETKFQASSQGMWFLRAPGYTSGSAGKGWLNCGDPNDVMKIIQPQGPTNPATGMLLDVADGRFVHQFPDLLDRGYIGFHIPQVIIPDYANVPEKWIEIWEDFEGYDPKKFMQEVLGIPTEEGMREITLQDIKNMCVIPESPATLKDICNQPNGRYKYVVSGCDWGGSDYNPAARTKVSYTVHVILGILWDGSIDIVHMRQYSGMDYRGVAQSICEDHKAYNAIGIASDFGVGAAYNMLLRENPAIQPERHIIFNYVGPQSAIVRAPAGAGWFNQYSLNRTEAITSLYSAIKAGRIRCYAWGMAQDRLLELLNLFRVPTEGPGGGATFKYQRHGSKADDTLHAINFGFALARIILNEPIVEDPTLRRVFNDTFNPAQSQFLNPYGSGGFDMGGHISG